MIHTLFPEMISYAIGMTTSRLLQK
jgi:hypothetical protein